LTNLKIYEKVNKIHRVLGKTAKKSFLTKKPVFFYLPYWSNLEVRHYIDVMHVEKNVYDNLIDTLLNI